VKTLEKQESSPDRKPGTILLIEDEDIVMDVNSALLSKLGFQVLKARTGKEAIDIAGAFDGKIDCAILDILLPDMEGKDVYPLLIEKQSSLKVIVCSGYSVDGPEDHLLKAGAQGYLQKPFNLNTLIQTLSEVLGEKISD